MENSKQNVKINMSFVNKAHMEDITNKTIPRPCG